MLTWCASAACCFYTCLVCVPRRPVGQLAPQVKVCVTPVFKMRWMKWWWRWRVTMLVWQKKYFTWILPLKCAFFINSNHKIILGDWLRQRYLGLVPKGEGFLIKNLFSPLEEMIQNVLRPWSTSGATCAFFSDEIFFSSWIYFCNESFVGVNSLHIQTLSWAMYSVYFATVNQVKLLDLCKATAVDTVFFAFDLRLVFCVCVSVTQTSRVWIRSES